jgi:hypothetical protein
MECGLSRLFILLLVLFWATTCLPFEATATQGFAESLKARFTDGGRLRYLFARKLGFQAGVDVARGPERTAFYLTVGNAW